MGSLQGSMRHLLSLLKEQLTLISIPALGLALRIPWFTFSPVPGLERDPLRFWENPNAQPLAALGRQ